MNPLAKVILYTNSKAMSISLQEKLEEFFDANTFTGDVVLVNGGLEASEKFFAIKLFLGNISSNAIVPRVGVFTAGAANCGIDDPLIYSVHRLGFPCSLLDLIQELGRAARRITASILTDSFRLFVNITDYAYVLIRAFRNCRDIIQKASKEMGTSTAVAKRSSRTQPSGMNKVRAQAIRIDRAKRNKIRDETDIREVIQFLCLDLGCFHARLEYVQCDPVLRNTFPFPSPCGNACYFCNKQYQKWFRSISFPGMRNYFMALFPLGKVLLSKAINLLWQDKTLLHGVFLIKSVNKYNVDGLFLQLLATGILSAAVGTDAFPDKTAEEIPDSLYVWITFDSNTGNPAYNMQHYWRGINLL
jgi:hypothetical protein